MEPSTSDPGNSTLVTLQPFIHQVGGHSSIQQFDQYTVCKPLFSKELRFYEEVCPAFEPFIPKFKGVLTVKYFNELGTSTCQVVSTHGDIRLHNYRYGKHCNTCSCQKESHHSREVQQKDAIEYYYSDEESTRFTMNNDDPSFNDSSLEYILLENVVGHCKYPCILDLKMGTEKHKDYMVSKEEADRRQARWDQTTSRSLGVRICGMKVYHVNKSDFLVKKGGRHLTIKGFKDAIKTFLYNGKRFRLDVIEPYLKQLGELLTVMESQSSYRFYNSSLLLIYEGEDYSKIDKSTGHCLNDEDPSMTVSSGAQNSRANVGVRMIDFAHVHYNNQTANSELLHVADEGYLFGLRSVIRILKETLVELQNNEPSGKTEGKNKLT